MNLLSGVDQDHHRQQTSPGAYEWWHFDGTDEKTGYSFSIQFFAGNLFSAYYQNNLKTYWQKTKSPFVEDSQTETPPALSDRRESNGPNPHAVSPPNPLDYSGVA